MPLPKRYSRIVEVTLKVRVESNDCFDEADAKDMLEDASYNISAQRGVSVTLLEVNGVDRRCTADQVRDGMDLT